MFHSDFNIAQLQMAVAVRRVMMRDRFLIIYRDGAR